MSLIISGHFGKIYILFTFNSTIHVWSSIIYQARWYWRSKQKIHSLRVVVKMEKTCELQSEPWGTLTDSGVGQDGSFLKSIADCQL